MLETKKMPDTIVKENNFAQISDENALAEIVEIVLSNNQKSIDDYRGGKTNALGFLVRSVHESIKRAGESCKNEETTA